MPAKAKSRAKKTSRRSLPEWAVWSIVGAILILAVAAFFYARDHPVGEAGQALLEGIPDEVGAETAFILYNREALFVDIRPVDEWETFHIENSVSIPLDQLSGRLGEVPLDGLIVVFDRSGESGPQARDLLLASGYARVTALAGGIQAWIAAGYPVQGTAPY